MKYNFYKKIALVCSLFIASFISLNALGYVKTKNCLPPNCHLLFVQIAQSGQLTLDQKDNHSFTLTLNKPEPYISYFTDRPQRITGLIPTHSFLKIWQKQAGIQVSPPNVALESSNAQNGQRINVVFELSNPVYNPVTKQITYNAKPLSNQNANLKSTFLGYTVLFIDDFNWGGNEIG